MHNANFTPAKFEHGLKPKKFEKRTSLMYFGKSDYADFKAHMMQIAPDMDCLGIYCKSTKHTCDYYTPKMRDITIIIENT